MQMSYSGPNLLMESLLLQEQLPQSRDDPDNLLCSLLVSCYRSFVT